MIDERMQGWFYGFPLCGFESMSGGYGGEDTPVPIPNTEVKLACAEDTWLVTARENRALPDIPFQKPTIFLLSSAGRACGC